jgi:hypothetical protein
MKQQYNCIGAFVTAALLVACGGPSNGAAPSAPSGIATNSQTHLSRSAGSGTLYAVGARSQPPAAGKKKKKRHRPTEIFNQFDTPPASSDPQPTNFEIVLSGNLVSALCGATYPPCLDQPVFGPYNPFCPPSHGANNPCYPTVTYNASNNTTTVTYSGPTLNYNEPGYPGLVHFGLLSTPSEPNAVFGSVLSSYFSYPSLRRRKHGGNSQSTSPQPTVNIAWKSNIQESAIWAYAEVFIDVSLKPGGAAVYGTWNEVAYVPKGSAQPHLTFTNFGKQTLYVVTSGIIPDQSVPTDPECQTDPACPENMTILSVLNYAGSPPPGFPSSSFIPLTYPPAKILKPTKPPV